MESPAEADQQPPHAEWRASSQRCLVVHSASFFKAAHQRPDVTLVEEALHAEREADERHLSRGHPTRDPLGQPLVDQEPRKVPVLASAVETLAKATRLGRLLAFKLIADLFRYRAAILSHLDDGGERALLRFGSRSDDGVSALRLRTDPARSSTSM
jgi:hypothetical protein